MRSGIVRQVRQLCLGVGIAAFLAAVFFAEKSLRRYWAVGQDHAVGPESLIVTPAKLTASRGNSSAPAFVTKSIELHNTSDYEIKVLTIRVGCGCTTLEMPEGLAIAPHGRAHLRATLRPPAFGGQNAAIRLEWQPRGSAAPPQLITIPVELTGEIREVPYLVSVDDRVELRAFGSGKVSLERFRFVTREASSSQWLASVRAQSGRATVTPLTVVSRQSLGNECVVTYEAEVTSANSDASPTPAFDILELVPHHSPAPPTRTIVALLSRQPAMVVPSELVVRVKSGTSEYARQKVTLTATGETPGVWQAANENPAGVTIVRAAPAAGEPAEARTTVWNIAVDPAVFATEAAGGVAKTLVRFQSAGDERIVVDLPISVVYE